MANGEVREESAAIDGLPYGGKEPSLVIVDELATWRDQPDVIQRESVGRTMLPMGQLVESPTNPRKTFRHLEELAASIRANPLGIVEPLVVRPLGPDYYVSAGVAGSEDSPVRYVACRNLVGHENLLDTFSGGTAEENAAAARERIAERNADAKYEIVAGARRFRAAQLAGLAEVPVTIVTLTDDEVLETQIIENLQREDPDPLEESEGYHALLARGYSVPQIAEKVGAAGRHRSYIYRRMALSGLIEAVKEALRSGKITIRHAQRIAGLPAESQPKGLELCYRTKWRKGPEGYGDYPDPDAGMVTEAELAQRIKEHVTLDLSAARWKLDDPDVLPAAGACRGCPKNSASLPEFYGEAAGEAEGGGSAGPGVVPGKKKRGRPRKGPEQSSGKKPKPGLCLDRACFQAKRQAFIQIEVDRAAAAGTPLVRIADYGFEAKDLPEGALTREQYALVDGKCGHAERAVMIAGGRHTNLGEKVWICRAKACPQHGQVRPAKSAKPTLAEERQRARAGLDAKIDTALREELLRRVAAGDTELDRSAVEKVQGMVLAWVLQRTGHDGRKELLKALRLDLGPKAAYDAGPKALEAYATELPPAGKLRFLLACAVADPYAGKNLEAAAKLLAVNPAAVRKEIAAPLEAAFRKRWDARAAGPKKKAGKPVVKKKAAAPAAKRKAKGAAR